MDQSASLGTIRQWALKSSALLAFKDTFTCRHLFGARKENTMAIAFGIIGVLGMIALITIAMLGNSMPEEF